MTNGSETAVVVALSAAYGGSVVARRDGRVVLVKGAFPGERVLIRIDERKADYDTATVIGIEEASPRRVMPECRHFGTCGGCHLQYLSHAGQLEFKQQVLQDCLERIGGIDVALSPPLHGSEPWAYRVRGQFKVAGTAVGFFREKSRDVVDIDHCPLMTRQVNEHLGILRSSLHSHFTGLAGGPGVAEAHLTCGDVPLLLLKTREKVTRREMRRIVSAHSKAGFAGVALESADGSVVADGASFTTFRLGDFSYTVSPFTFLQSNWELNQAVVGFLKDGLGPLEGKKIVDLYAGAGNFSLALCSGAAEVLCVETHQWAVRDGRMNAALNGIGNCTFSHANAGDVPGGGCADIVILDPPRAGLTNRVIDRVTTLRAGRIAYVSCNPATFARDLKKLLKSYAIKSVSAVDFFPQTYHIEAIAFLRLR